MPKKNSKPAPVVVTEVCSMCGLDWRRHGEDPTTEDCVRLLRAELASRPVTIPYVPVSHPAPVWPWNEYGRRPVWISAPTITCDSQTATPNRAEITCYATSTR